MPEPRLKHARWSVSDVSLRNGAMEPLPETLFPDTKALIVRDFALEADNQPDWEAIRKALAVKVTELLDRNPSMLMSILYRIDVLERHVKRVFHQSAPDHLALDLADLIIERQLQKVRIRAYYREQNQG